MDEIENLNNNINDDKVEPTLEKISEDFALNKEEVLHPTSFNTNMSYQQKDKSLINIAKEKSNDYSIKQFHEIVTPKQIQNTLDDGTITYCATQAKPGPNYISTGKDCKSPYTIFLLNNIRISF